VGNIGFLSVESAIVIQAGVDKLRPMVMFWHRFPEPDMTSFPSASWLPARREAHRAPDPAPFDEPPADPFENFDPHQPPIRTPNNDEPPVDSNPSILRSRVH
jgi:hypothetical protein